MADDEGSGFTVPRGATGFFRPRDGPLPETGLPTLRSALYAAARAARGTVGALEPRAYPRTFHTATVVDGTGEHVVLCHAHHPWIAFARERLDWYTEEFLAPPPWARAFAGFGFVVLDRARLTAPLTEADTSDLARVEWSEIRHHGVTQLGGVLFTTWD
ncbi:hypothetical protein [Actinacidiphila yeochonensis]|uniref:hypothetical protein n=1 Tax=Actinacidiphila yeochonensis TaxID=89050 RepID=UPI0005699161|nr:hypothetical protein [Actinacidiphila yeochonensis]